MAKTGFKKTALLISMTLAPVLAIGILFWNSNPLLNKSKASTYFVALDNSNSPTLDAGEGTMIDENNVIWEYNNAANNPNGHITLNHQGYFGVSSSSEYGYTKIEGITAYFTKGTTGELWLLTSYDGEHWSEQTTLESGILTEEANDWRYVRFYCYDDTNTPINVNSVVIDYECTGISSTDDIDSAFVGNVRASTNLNYFRETTKVSPRGDSTEAIRFSKISSGDSSCTITLRKTYTLSDIFTFKVEFDFNHEETTFKPSVALMNGNSVVGTTQSYGSKTNYKVSDIDENWWHIEIHITSMVALICDTSYGDKYTADGPVNGIKIGNGNSVIDNLRIVSDPSPLPNPLGLYNNGLSFNVNGVYWVKVSWVGMLHSCTFTFSDDSIAEPSGSPNSPFYIRGLARGTVVVTATIVAGYNRQSYTIQSTITVK